MNSNCMYGDAHPGDAVAVRSKVGRTVGWLCGAHYHQHQKSLENNGYHFRTSAELAARGELNGGTGQANSAAKSVDTSSAQEQQQSEHGNSGGDSQSVIPTSELHAPRHPGREPHGSEETRRLADNGRHTPACDTRPAAQELETVSRGEAPSQGRLPDTATGAKAVGVPDWPTWAEGAGHLVLTPTQREHLQSPFRDDEITIRYDGVVYAPWRRYWTRMIEAFAPSVPAVIPIDNPRFQGSEIVVGVVMVCDGKFIGKAWGSHRLEGENDRMSVGDRIESAISDAIAKIGKRLNMGEDLWNDSFRDYWKSQYAESYTNGKRTHWRRKPVAYVKEHE